MKFTQRDWQLFSTKQGTNFTSFQDLSLRCAVETAFSVGRLTNRQTYHGNYPDFTRTKRPFQGPIYGSSMLKYVNIHLNATRMLWCNNTGMDGSQTTSNNYFFRPQSRTCSMVLEYLSTFRPTITQRWRQIYQHHGP